MGIMLELCKNKGTMHRVRPSVREHTYYANNKLALNVT